MVFIYIISAIVVILLLLVFVPFRFCLQIAFEGKLELGIKIMPFLGSIKICLRFMVNRETDGSYSLYRLMKNGKTKRVFPSLKKVKKAKESRYKVRVKNLIFAVIKSIRVEKLLFDAEFGVEERADMTALAVGFVQALLFSVSALLESLQKSRCEIKVRPRYSGGFRFNIECIIRLSLANIIQESKSGIIIKKEGVKHAATSH